MWRGGRLTAPSTTAPLAQRRTVRMTRSSLLVLADLPVDVVVVLEQQERASEAKRTERALPRR